VRLITPDDSITELTQLINRAYKDLADMGLKYVGTWQDEEITRKRISTSECYLGIIDGKIVATINLRNPGTGKGPAWYERGDVAFFSQFCVEPELRRQGIGSYLLEYAENRAREIGAGELALDTAEPAKHLIAYYEKRGYRFIEYFDWKVTNYRSVIMSKTL
jgi:GNAT superfamily N-acetyltransferase